MQKSIEFNIDLNGLTNLGDTPFHLACLWNHKTIIEMLLINAEAFKIDLGVKDNYGKTGFQLSYSQRVWRCAQYNSEEF